VFWHGEDRRYRNVASRFRELVRRAVAKAELEGRSPLKPFRFHDLRHWFAVDYLRNGGSIYTLQQILGHTSIKTTERYLDHLTPDENVASKRAALATE
jgi:integrase/recombinase XerD